jgi:hypothetical protein
MLSGLNKSLETWICDTACSTHGAKNAHEHEALIFTKRLFDVFDDEIDRIAKELEARVKTFKLVKHDRKPEAGRNKTKVLSHWYRTYNWVTDNGYKNFADWIL